ncbi:hypothetical protein X732_31575 [Mesorhizobium sp. L2C066B000]|nr:hypothetical protein X732_31575 [Mesorhizobium sp. L2C066B000]
MTFFASAMQRRQHRRRRRQLRRARRLLRQVSNDALGEIYAHDIHAQGVAFDTEPLVGQPPTACSMIFVTPDGERLSRRLLRTRPDDVEPDKASGTKVTYFEGYLGDPPRAKQAIRQTARLAHAAGREVSMTLSYSFCVDPYRDEFVELIRSGTAAAGRLDRRDYPGEYVGVVC